MGNLLQTIREKDPDDVFAYDTLKVVTIRDRRLGLIHYTLMLGIFCYIVVYNIILQGGYRDYEDPIGNVRTTLLRPKQYLPQTELSYCNSTQPGVKGTIPCYYGDQFDVVFPPVESDATFITTRVKKSYFPASPECENQQLSPSCANRTHPQSQEYYYFADIEHFTLLMEHTVRAESLDLTLLSTNLKGHIDDMDGKEIQSFKEQHRIGDIITIETLLNAAGVSLQDDSFSPFSKPGETLRNAGTVFIIFIVYKNDPEKPSSLTYTYNVRYIKGAEFKAEETRWGSKGDLTVLDRHGIRVVFIQTGSIGKLSFVRLLINLVSGLVLVKVATTLVDVVAMRILPQRDIYRKYKYEKTLDFSDIRDGIVSVPETDSERLLGKAEYD